MRIALATPLRNVKTLAAALGAAAIPMGLPAPEIKGISTHAAECQAGDLFLAIRGRRHNGAGFIPQALARGAAGVLTDRPVPLPRQNYWHLRVPDIGRALLRAASRWRRVLGARVIGVTGSSGKTTVKELLATMLAEKYRVAKTEGNHNSAVGLPLSLLSVEAAEIVVAELGVSAPGEMQPLAATLAPDIAVLLGVGSAHIGNFPDYEALLREKLLVALGLTPDGWLVLPTGLPHAPDIAPNICSVGQCDADVVAEAASYGAHGTRATVRAGEMTVPDLTWPLAGRTGLSTLLFAVAVGRLCGLDAPTIRRGISRAALQTPRMQTVRVGDRLLIDDTYNASPEAMRAALEGLFYLAADRPRVAVLGDMAELGAKAAGYHETVGMLAAGCGLAHLYLYGDAARDYARGALRAGILPDALHIFEKGEGAALVAALSGELPRNAAVLFKGSRTVALDEIFQMLREALK